MKSIEAGVLGHSAAQLRDRVMRNLFARLVKEEQGGEVLEYALIAGLIVVAAIAAISVVGTKVLARWNSLSGASF
ncbi:MAG TPA: Flp family type IVb pilin [Tepidisphaeraceae bacterium]|nr:Flp family type IVb pilin [Tepidisphaeraceae bacterium]